MNDSIPFVQAKPRLVKVPDRGCFIDGYIDDGIAACVDINDNLEKLQNCAPLAIHLISHPLGDPAGQMLARQASADTHPQARYLDLKFQNIYRVFSK